jgi:hypothetical protein
MVTLARYFVASSSISGVIVVIIITTGQEMDDRN